MNKEKFDYYWKVSLIIILTIAICYMFYEWRSINNEAMACKNAPFEWGQAQAKKSGLSCYYQCFDNSMDNLNTQNMTFHIP